jgi:hypothetical protein
MVKYKECLLDQSIGISLSCARAGSATVDRCKERPQYLCSFGMFNLKEPLPLMIGSLTEASSGVKCC